MSSNNALEAGFRVAMASIFLSIPEWIAALLFWRPIFGTKG